jgi:hypothetical protein
MSVADAAPVPSSSAPAAGALGDMKVLGSALPEAAPSAAAPDAKDTKTSADAPATAAAAAASSASVTVPDLSNPSLINNKVYGPNRVITEEERQRNASGGFYDEVEIEDMVRPPHAVRCFETSSLTCVLCGGTGI